jgi:hypothetical protein
MSQTQQIKSQILQGNNMDEKLEQAKRIVSRDEDQYYINKLTWIDLNFKREDPIFEMYVEETVENCLDLAVRHAFEHYVRTQEMIKQHQLIETPQNVKKLTQPTTRWSGLPERVTYTYSCTECHALMVGPNDGCKCPGLPYAEHDNVMNPECRKTCAERYGETS